MRKLKVKTVQESGELIKVDSDQTPTTFRQVKNGAIMNFCKKTKSRLAEYKATKFPNRPDGFWKTNGQSYGHILPEASKFDNFLPTYKDKLESYIRDKQIKLHSDFHHLNSSQAMCLNFFFPLYSERKLELITNVFGLTNETVRYETACFEKDGLERELGSKRPTKFDFFFETKSNKKLYFEIKYTEGKFGPDSETDLDKRNSKFKKLYSNSLEPLHNLFHSSQAFSDHYQILRNLIHIGENSYVIFVYPRDNDGVCRGVNKVTTDFLIPKYHDHFFATTWEKLFESVSTSMDNTNIKRQLIDFREKYLPLT